MQKLIIKHFCGGTGEALLSLNVLRMKSRGMSRFSQAVGSQGLKG